MSTAPKDIRTSEDGQSFISFLEILSSTSIVAHMLCRKIFVQSEVDDQLQEISVYTSLIHRP
jgi:hypothetical protein